MPDTVIVTIKYGNKAGENLSDSWEADFELPAKQPFKSWENALREALKNCFPGIRLEGKKLVLDFQKTVIPTDASLGECGIYDGAILELQMI